MGRARKRQLANAGGAVERPKALDHQMTEDDIVKRKRLEIFTEEGPKEEVDQITPRQLNKVLRRAQKQTEELQSDDEEQKNVVRLLGDPMNDDNCDEEEEINKFNPEEVKVNEDDARDLERFLQPTGERTIYDLIRQKLAEKSQANLMQGDDKHSNIPPEAVALYREVGTIMSRYRSGRIPVAFKNLSAMHNWEQLIEFTHPENWSSAAMYHATRLFVANQKKLRCQRFLTLVLLPRIRDEIVSHKRLNNYLYQSLFKACFRPAEFYKGIVLPLAESGGCTLTESVIIGSVIMKCKIPQIHSCAALYRLAAMRGSTFASGVYFIYILIKKRYALPYQVVDQLVEYYAQTATANEELPIIWHESFLSFVEAYANDLSGPQVSVLQLVAKEKQNHHRLSRLVCERLQETEAKLEKEGAMEI